MADAPKDAAPAPALRAAPTAAAWFACVPSHLKSDDEPALHWLKRFMPQVKPDSAWKLTSEFYTVKTLKGAPSREGMMAFINHGGLAAAVYDELHPARKCVRLHLIV